MGPTLTTSPVLTVGFCPQPGSDGKRNPVESSSGKIWQFTPPYHLAGFALKAAFAAIYDDRG